MQYHNKSVSRLLEVYCANRNFNENVGDLWNEYTISAINSWEKLYMNYLGFTGPTLFVHHSDLKRDIKSEMHRLTKFLNIRADVGKFKCISYNPKSRSYQHTPIKLHFDPYQLLKPTVHKMINVSKLTIMKLINQHKPARK